MTKKKDSIFTEPYYLAKLVCEAALFLFASVRTALVGASSAAAKDSTVNAEEASAAYLRLQAELREENAAASWKRFLVTGLSIQAFLMVLMLLHSFLGNYLIVVELLVLVVFSIVLFGYKPWILRNKAVVPFVEYVKRIPSDPGCLVLWNSLKVLD